MFREATRLLRTLDNDLKRIYGIRRDIVVSDYQSLRRSPSFIFGISGYRKLSIEKAYLYVAGYYTIQGEINRRFRVEIFVGRD